MLSELLVGLLPDHLLGRRCPVYPGGGPCPAEKSGGGGGGGGGAGVVGNPRDGGGEGSPDAGTEGNRDGGGDPGGAW